MTTNSKKTRAFLESLAGPLTFGMMIRAYLDREDMSQVDLAKKLGVTRGYVSNVVNDRKLVSVHQAIEIARVLGEPEQPYISAAFQDLLRDCGADYEVELKKRA